MPINATTVFLAALVTALATGAGAFPFLFKQRMSRQGMGLANAIAAGLMMAASVMLFYEGLVYSLLLVVLGVVLGVVFILISQRLLKNREDLHIGSLEGADARKALLILGVMTIHSVTEGVGVGVSYGGGEQLGVFITTAIALHNIPEGLAISLVLIPKGTSIARAGWLSICSSLPQPVMALPAYLFVEMFRPLLPIGLGFAAGAMVWMVFHELLPDARANARSGHVFAALVFSCLAMLAFQVLLK